MTAFCWLLAAYLTPTIVAILRNHHLTVLVAIVNAITGWTIVGWFATLVWACFSDPQRS